MNETLKRALTVCACILMGCAVALVLSYRPAAATETQAQTSQPMLMEGQRKYAELLAMIDMYYIGDDVDIQDINDGMSAGVIAGLGDRWSYYISAEDYQSYANNLNNEYVGVGVTIQAKLDDADEMIGYEIIDVTAGGPADEAGILAGFVLIRVDGTDVTDMSISEVKQMVKGEAGTRVDMTFLTDDDQEATFSVERRALPVIPATGWLMDDGLGLVTIENFDAGCADTVIGICRNLISQGATGLIFDVRNNPGGMKKELVAILDYLLPEGVIFHSVNYAGEEEIIHSDADCVDLPMAVLVNASSYSAAEYFACALQEYEAAVVVGEQTYGKGYYQVGVTLSDGSAVNLSVGKYYTPSGKSLIDVGVTPDEEILLDSEQYTLLAREKLEPEDDPQLQAAISRLSE